MTSWAVVADVWYLEPQEMQPGEDAIQFAERVRGMICQQAGIKPVPWVGRGDRRRRGRGPVTPVQKRMKLACRRV